MALMSVEEASSLITEGVLALGVEEVPVAQAAGRVLVRDLPPKLLSFGVAQEAIDEVFCGTRVEIERMKLGLDGGGDRGIVDIVAGGLTALDGRAGGKREQGANGDGGGADTNGIHG
jgi:hypothetical protein